MEQGGVSIRGNLKGTPDHPLRKTLAAATTSSNRTSPSEYTTASRLTARSRSVGKQEFAVPNQKPLQKAIQCTLCGRRYATENALTMHAREKHPNMTPQLQKFGDKLRVSSATAPHLMLDSGKTVHCRACKLDFKDANALAMHFKMSGRHKDISKPGMSFKAYAPVPSPLFPLATSTDIQAGKGLSTPGVMLPDRRRAPGSTEPMAARVLAKAVHPKEQPERPQWSELSPEDRQIAHNVLSHYCVPLEKLPAAYLRREATTEDIDGYRRCKNCNGLQKELIRMKKPCVYHPLKRPDKDNNKKEKSPVLSYACCGERGKGCVTTSQHDYGSPDPIMAARLQGYKATPAPTGIANPNKRFAVALDCEMVGVNGGQDVVSVGAVDYLTGEVLVDKLVNPSQQVTQWRSQVTGITKAKVMEAVSQGTALHGKNGARAELWKYIDSDTILIGHCLHYDLDVLGIVHPKIVDSEIIIKTAIGSPARSWGLKSLAKSFLGMIIQTKKSGHNSLEDALATREVVLWCTHNPLKLMEWASEQRREMEEERLAREKAKEEKKKQEQEKAAAQAAAQSAAVERGETTIPSFGLVAVRQ